MPGIDSVSKAMNYSIKLHTDIINNKIGCSKLSTIKKVLQVLIKAFAAFDLYYIDKVLDRPVVLSMKGAVDLIEFHSLYNNVIYWINPFSKKTLDEESLLKSLVPFLTTQKNEKMQKKWGKLVLEKVMKKNDYDSASEVRDVLKKSLEKMCFFKPEEAQKISHAVTVKQKSRSFASIFSTASFTVLNLTGNALVLKKWGIADLSNIATKIGSQSKIFYFVFNLGTEKFFGIVSSAALIVLVGDASYRVIINGLKVRNETDLIEKEKAYKKFCEALSNFISGGADLISSVAPLIFILSPPTIVALALFSKGTGLICVLIKD